MRTSLDSQGATRIWVFEDDSPKEVTEEVARDRSGGLSGPADRLRGYTRMSNVLKQELKMDYNEFIADGSEIWFASRNFFWAQKMGKSHKRPNVLPNDRNINALMWKFLRNIVTELTSRNEQINPESYW